MFVILYYDVNSKRCSKMLKTCRKYLRWVQNSVFEGEISESSLKILTEQLKNIIKGNDGDSVVIYEFKNIKYYKREVLGLDKKGENLFL